MPGGGALAHEACMESSDTDGSKATQVPSCTSTVSAAPAETQRWSFVSSAGSTAQQFASEAEAELRRGSRAHTGETGRSAEESASLAGTAGPMSRTQSEGDIPDTEMGRQASLPDEASGAAQRSCAPPRRSKGRPPTAPGSRQQQRAHSKFEASDASPSWHDADAPSRCEPSSGASREGGSPYRTAPYLAGDLTIGSLPSMLEQHDGAAESKRAHLSKSQLQALVDAVVRATACATREEIRLQFATIKFGHGEGAGPEKGPRASRRGDARAMSWTPSDRHSLDDSSSNAGSAADCGVRALESFVARSILEEHGLAESPSGPQRLSTSWWRQRTVSQSPGGRRSSVSLSSSRRQETGTALEEDFDSIIGGSPAARPEPHREESRASSGAPAGPRKLRLPVLRGGEPHGAGGFDGELGEGGPCDARDTTDSEDSPEGSWRLPPRPCGVPWPFRACGLMPWSSAHASALYRLALAALCMAVLGGLASDMARGPSSPTCHPDSERPCWQQRGLLGIFPLVAFVLGTVASACRAPVGKDLGGALEVLIMYMQRQNIIDAFGNKLARVGLQTVLTWLLVALAASIGTALDSRSAGGDPYAWPYCLALILTAAFVASWTYCMLFIFAALTAMLDRFCYDLASTADMVQAMRDWRVLQAALIRASCSMEWSFIVMLCVVSCAVPLLCADLVSLGGRWAAVPSVLPGALIVLTISRAFFAAASITEKCARVPALVNSFDFGPGMEMSREHLAESIRRSDLGFVVCHLRLTWSMALKFAYVWAVVALGIATVSVNA